MIVEVIRSQESGVRMRKPAKTFEDLLVKDLGYGDISETKLLLQKVSKFLEAYSRGILNSDY